jgi:aerobic carbon-monoxide dehydrogenase medium subunit
MTPFAYHRPASIASAVQLRSAQPDATYLAGGQSLLPAMKLGLAGPSELIDLSLLPGTQGITLDGASLRIGAMTAHAAVAASSEVLKHIPALACLASGIGDPAVRSRGTVGGSLAQNDPAACWPAAALGLGATVHTDRRQIAADDFFKGLYETALEAGELITAVSLPVPKRAAYVKFKQPASRFALVGVFVSEGPQGVRVAVTGAGPCVFRADTLEAALAKGFGAQALDGLSVSAEGLNNDLHGSAAYRAHLVGVLARRAVAQAV